MDVHELEGYAEVKDNNKPVYIAVVAVAFFLTVYFVILRNPVHGYHAGLLYTSLFFIPLFQAFRRRVCSTCGTPMKRFYRALLPVKYYCEKCKLKVKTPVNLM